MTEFVDRKWLQTGQAMRRVGLKKSEMNRLITLPLHHRLCPPDKDHFEAYTMWQPKPGWTWEKVKTNVK